MYQGIREIEKGKTTTINDWMEYGKIEKRVLIEFCVLYSVIKVGTIFFSFFPILHEIDGKIKHRWY